MTFINQMKKFDCLSGFCPPSHQTWKDMHVVFGHFSELKIYWFRIYPPRFWIRLVILINREVNLEEWIYFASNKIRNWVLLFFKDVGLSCLGWCFAITCLQKYLLNLLFSIFHSICELGKFVNFWPKPELRSQGLG